MNLHDLPQDVGVHFWVGLHVDETAGAIEALDKAEKKEADLVFNRQRRILKKPDAV